LIGGEEMAHIKKLYDQDNKIKGYKAFVEVGKDPATGKRKRQTKVFKRKKDADKWLINKVNSIQNGSYVNPSQITLGDFILNRWLENHKKPKVTITTYDRYKSLINAHIIPALGEIPIQELQPFHIEHYFSQKRKKGIRNKKGLSENSLKRHYVLLNNALKRAVKLKLIKYNPMQAIESPKPEKYEAPVMKENEYNKLLESLKEDTFMYTFVMTLISTGMRRSEILGLEWNDIDLKQGTIFIRKRLITITGGIKHEHKTKNESSKRLIKIPKALIPIIKSYKIKQKENKLFFGTDYYKEKDYVFCKPDGYPYNPQTLNVKFNIVLRKINLPQKFTLHTLRHTFATINLRNGVPAKVVQEMLGHSTITTTLDLYTHVDLDMQEEAAEKLQNTIKFE